MEQFAWGGTTRWVQVVSGDSLDCPALPRFGFTVYNRLGRLDRGTHGERRQNFRPGLSDFGDGSQIHVIRVSVGNKDEVRFWRPGELRRFGWVEVNSFSSRLDQRARVIQRSDLDLSCGSWKRLWGGRGICGIRHSEEQANESQKQFHLDLTATFSSLGTSAACN